MAIYRDDKWPFIVTIGVLLLPDHGSGIPCRPNCDNAMFLDNSNSV